MPAADKIGAQFKLPPPTSHYLREVLRLEAGDKVDLFDGSGRVLQARLKDLSEDVVVEVLYDLKLTRAESPAELTLVQALPKGKNFELVLEKSTELGVARVIPLESARTIVQIKPAKLAAKLGRWRRIVEQAARQSGRTITPEVLAPMGIVAALDHLDDAPSIVAHTGDNLPSIARIFDPDSPLNHGARRHVDRPAAALWVGPEGGFSPDEIEQLSARGARLCSMGPRVLRTETAGLVGLALIQAAIGDMG